MCRFNEKRSRYYEKICRFNEKRSRYYEKIWRFNEKRSRYNDIIEWKKYYVWAVLRHRNFKILKLLKFFFTCHFTLLYFKTVTIHTVAYAYHLVQMFRILKASK